MNSSAEPYVFMVVDPALPFPPLIVGTNPMEVIERVGIKLKPELAIELWRITNGFTFTGHSTRLFEGTCSALTDTDSIQARDWDELPTFCSRAACRQTPAPCKHTQTGDHYCVKCARKINEANPGLILIPTEYDRAHRQNKRRAYVTHDD